MIDDLGKSLDDLLRAGDGDERRRLPLRLADLFYYGDFEIAEQVVSGADADRVNVIGLRAGSAGADGGLLLCAGVDPMARGGLSPDGRFLLGDPGCGGPAALLCALAAAERIERADLVRPLALAGTFAGPTGNGGARTLVESGRVSPSQVLVGEATSLELADEDRGLLRFALEIREREPSWRRAAPARSAVRVRVPVAVEPAPVRLRRLLDALAERGEVGLHNLHCVAGPAGPASVVTADLLFSETELPLLPPDIHSEPLEPEARLSAPAGVPFALWFELAASLESALTSAGAPRLESMESGAEGLRIGFAYAPAPGEEPYAVFRRVDGAVADVQADCADRIAIRLRATANLPPLQGPASSLFRSAVESALGECGLPIIESVVADYTEAGMYASCGLDTLILGPGRREGHPTCRWSLMELEKTVDVYEGVIRRLCT